MFRSEILAPAGNLFKLKTAVRYGADAVYLAGQRFGLRSAADNFTVAEIAEGCRYAHQAGAKVYVVLNGFLFGDEIEQMPPFLAELEEAGVDALIISDLGVVTQARRHCQIPIHLSTQASTLNVAAARLWKSFGVTRIVLGREVSIEEAAHIKREAGVEVELFIHGAMCMAFSGNCTISNYTAGRDSNRGGCVQSCRFKYELNDAGPVGHFFSSKDLQGVQQMARFLEYEIDSLKIEGRMKSALYVATTVRAYAAARRAVETGTFDETLTRVLDELNTMSHRDYTEASLTDKAGADSVYDHADSEQRHTHEMMGHVLEIAVNGDVAVYLRNPLQAGEPLFVLATDGGTYQLDTRELRDLRGTVIAKANPNQVVLLPAHDHAQKDLLLRKPKDATIHDHAASA